MAQKRFLSLDDLTHMPQPQWMIEGLFEVTSLVMLAGPPGNYKSFLALDWMMCMATGRQWLGRPTVQTKVLYVLGEGKASLIKRMQIWMEYNHVTRAEEAKLKQNFLVTFDVTQMASKASVDNLLAGLAEEKYYPSVVVIDTLARSLVGLDENSQRDIGMWVESAERLRDNGMTVIALHHTKKSTEFGLQYRGSSALMGAMDTAMTLSKDGSASRVVLNVTKQKDHDEGDPIHFNRLIVAPKDNPGDEGSVILVPVPSIDERFTEEGNHVNEIIEKLLADPTYTSDAERGRELKRMGLVLTDGAGITRIKRYKQDHPQDMVSIGNHILHMV